MQDLVVVKNGSVVCTSLMMAEKFNKEHKNVIQAIRNVECSAEFRELNFKLSYYTSSQNKEMHMYELTRDGFTFVAMGFTGREASEWKEKYINAFNMMEKQILEGHKPALSNLQAVPDIAKAFDSLMSIAERIGCDRNAAAISANQGCLILSGQNMLALIGHTHLVAEKQQLYFTPTELGRRVGKSAMVFNKGLERLGLQINVNKVWEVTEEGKRYSRIFDAGKSQGYGVPVQQIKWSDEVLALVK